MLEKRESDGRVTLEARGRIETFASYVPQAVLWDLAASDHAHDQPHAERFPAALLVIDITGFTGLTAAALRGGPAGTERFSRSVNAYLGQIIDIVIAHGGDISKIVGDALLPVWPARDGDLAAAAHRAARCGLAIASELGDLEVAGDIRLSAKVGAYIPPVSLARLDAGQADWLAELRRTTAVFVNVRGVANDTPDAIQLLHQVTVAAQRVFGRYDGWLKELTMDDKGTTLVGAFGVPPFSHEDDPGRAINAALEVQSEIRELGLRAGVGVATGPAFCGPFGNAKRRDFAILGQNMNLAARLMQAADDDGVLVDGDTHAGSADRQTLERQTFERLAAFVLKGLTTPIDVYRVRGTPAPDHPTRLVDRINEQAIASMTLDEVKD